MEPNGREHRKAGEGQYAEEFDPSEYDFETLKPIEIPVKYQGKKYILCEATEDVAIDWQNASSRGLRIKNGKVVGLGNVGDSEPILLAGCLFEVVNEGGTEERIPVDEYTLRTWPSRVVRPLFDRAKKISKLEAKSSKKDREKLLTELVEELYEEDGEAFADAVRNQLLFLRDHVAEGDEGDEGKD